MKKLIIMISLFMAFPALADGGLDNSHLNTNSGNYNHDTSEHTTTNSNNDESQTTVHGNQITDAGIVNVSSGRQEVTTTTKQEIKSNQASTAVSPNLTTGGVDVCLGSVSGGASVAGFGISGGSTTLDENCVMIKQVKLLTSLGLKDAAIVLMMSHDEAIMQAVMMAYPDLYKHLYDEQRIQNAFR